uniref:Uncharacterized protein n=1 Tax=Arundo donax TaxID=35708 RepID=A0A0A9D078_ARUDO
MLSARSKILVAHRKARMTEDLSVLCQDAYLEQQPCMLPGFRHM